MAPPNQNYSSLPDNTFGKAAFRPPASPSPLSALKTMPNLPGRFEGPGEVDQSDSVSYYPEDREAGFVLLCTGRPKTSLRIRTHQATKCASIDDRKNFPPVLVVGGPSPVLA